jgi:RNA polymerase sigma-70 factor (family 1)
MDDLKSAPAGFSMDALKQGNEEMFAILFHDFYPVLFNFANRLVQDTCTAEEIAEDVFVKLWERTARFDSFQSVKAFLYIATRNSCLDHLKKIKRGKKHYHELLYLATATEEEVLHTIIRGEVLREISHAIRQLPAHYNTVIQMTFDEGLKAGEIAAITGMPVSTIRNQQARGLALLRKILTGGALEVLLICWLHRH